MKLFGFALRPALALALFAPALAGQVVVQPHTARLDSTQSGIQRTVFRLRDSLKYVDGAVARIARDLRTTSDAAVRSRARHLSERCAAAARTIPGASAIVTAARRPEPDSGGIRRTMEQALQLLAGQMERCGIEFLGLTTPTRVQELRDYGIGRAARVQQAIRQYEEVLRRYYQAATGERYFPDFAGAGATPRGP